MSSEDEALFNRKLFASRADYTDNYCNSVYASDFLEVR